MPYQQSVLPSGIRVVTETIPDVRSVALGFWVGVGSRDEHPVQAGCSHFLEHLLFKGTTRRSARDIAEALDAVGGEMNAFTSKELTCFYARVLDRDLPLAVDVLGDMMVDATNTPEDVESERQVVLEEINIHLDTPEDLAHSDLSALVLGDHPLALETLGTVDSITSMARDTIHDYYRHHYRPANVSVVAAGNLDHDELVRLVGEQVGDLGRPGGERPERSAPGDVPQGRIHIRHRPTEQVHVALGGLAIKYEDDRRYPLRVLNSLVGGGMSSRLFQEIREQRGLAYSTYSYAAAYTDGGMYGAYAGTTPNRVDEALKVLREQLDQVADDVTEAEVERAKGSLMGGTALALEDTGSRMTRIGKLLVLDAELISVEETIERTAAVTLDQVRDVARDVVAGERSLAVVGPFDEDDTSRFQGYVS